MPYHRGRPMASTETRKMVLVALAACDDKKGEDTRVLQLDPADSAFTDFFIITSASNERQAQAIADEIEFRIKRDFGAYPNSVEGRRLGEWVLLDYVDFVVHIFLHHRRTFYDIERLRKSARIIALAEITAALTEKTLAARKKAPAKRVAQKAPAKTAAGKPAAKKAAAKKPAKTARKSPRKSAK
jgi:ribosome-associated protein